MSSVLLVPDLISNLRQAGVAHLAEDSLTRALYSSDASPYRSRLAPWHPRAMFAELEACLAAARGQRVPVTVRGAGTSTAGNAIGPGLVLDLSRHLGRVLELDPAAQTARVQPEVISRAANWTHEDYLAAVLEREVSARKTFEDIDFDAQPAVRQQIAALASGAFLTDARNIVLLGSPGTGKTTSPPRSKSSPPSTATACCRDRDRLGHPPGRRPTAPTD